MQQLTLEGKICKSEKPSTIEELEKIWTEQYLIIEESNRQKYHEKKLSDMEKLKELKGRIEEGKIHLSSRFHQIAKKYDLDRGIIKKAIKSGEKKNFEDYIKRIENGEESLLYHAEILADKHWLDRTKLKKAAEKCFERLLEKIEEVGYTDEYWKEIWELSDNYGFDGNRIMEAHEISGIYEAGNISWDEYCGFCFKTKKCPFTAEGCKEMYAH